MPDFKKTIKQSEACNIMGLSHILRVLLYGGSRSGKSFIIVRQLVIRALKAPGSRHLILRLRFNHVKQSIWMDTLPKVIDICFPEIKGLIKWNESDHYIEFPNKSQIWIGGLDDKDRSDKILGNEYASEYFNEVSQISYKSVQIALTRLAQKTNLVNRAYFDCNPPTKKHWTYKIWFELKDPISNNKLTNPEIYGSHKLQPDDNKENLGDGYIENTLDTMTGSNYKRFRKGEYAEEAEGALWNDDLINRFRVVEKPVNMNRIGIGVDPAVTSNQNSDETGIITAGKGTNGHYYVWKDNSGIYTPNGWGSIVVNTFHNEKADFVVAEVNQGGDLVESNIRNIDRNVKVIKVHASRGKVVRAEPIQGLYEMGLVHHVGELMDLEYQMTTWDVLNDNDSPNRVDALVWILTELSNKSVIKPGKFSTGTY